MQKNLDKNIIINLLTKNYELGKNICLDNYTKGYCGDNCILETECGKYFLKKYNAGSKSMMDFLIHSMNHFYLGGVPVVIPIKNKNNKHYFIHENQYYALFPYISDLKLALSLSDKQLYSAGKMLAKIHLIGKKGYKNNSDRTTESIFKIDFYKKIKPIMEAINKKKKLDHIDKLFLGKLEIKKEMVKRYEFNLESLGLISNHLSHGDFHQRNFSFGKDDNINYVFDFKSRITPRELELFRSMDLICFNGNYKNKNFKDAGLFLKGYQSVYPLQMRQIKNGILAHYIKNFYGLLSETEYYVNDNHTVKNILKNTLETLKFSSKNLDGIINKIATFVE